MELAELPLQTGPEDLDPSPDVGLGHAPESEGKRNLREHCQVGRRGDSGASATP